MRIKHESLIIILKKTGNIENSFEKIDTRFFEINKILNDLNKSKALLKKTNYVAPHDYSAKYTPSHSYTLHIKDEKTDQECLSSIYNDLKRSKVLSHSDFNLVRIHFLKYRTIKLGKIDVKSSKRRRKAISLGIA